MKLLMTTRASVDVIDYLYHTLPLLRKYAKECGAEFKILDKIWPHHQSVSGLDESALSISHRLMNLHWLLDEYDRVFHLDADMVITKNCPNIFDTVPYDTMGLVFEDKGSRLKDRRAQIAQIKSAYGGNENWVSGYFNCGMFIVSRPHKEIFTEIDGKFWGDDFKVQAPDQAHFSYQLAKQGHKYIDLGYKWNHISPFSEPWNGSPSRFDSYIIHYAGGARFPDKGKRTRVQLIKDDIEKIYGDKK